MRPRCVHCDAGKWTVDAVWGLLDSLFAYVLAFHETKYNTGIGICCRYGNNSERMAPTGQWWQIHKQIHSPHTKAQNELLKHFSILFKEASGSMKVVQPSFQLILWCARRSRWLMFYLWNLKIIHVCDEKSHELTRWFVPSGFPINSWGTPGTHCSPFFTAFITISQVLWARVEFTSTLGAFRLIFSYSLCQVRFFSAEPVCQRVQTQDHLTCLHLHQPDEFAVSQEVARHAYYHLWHSKSTPFLLFSPSPMLFFPIFCLAACSRVVRNRLWHFVTWQSGEIMLRLHRPASTQQPNVHQGLMRGPTGWLVSASAWGTLASLPTFTGL